MKQVALITGGSRGIGLGIARRLAADHFDLALCGRRPESDVTHVLDELRALGADALYVPADVADPRARTALLDRIATRFGRLNALVNNAGIAPRERADILEATEESFQEVLRVNLQGPYFLTQAVARQMIRRRQEDPDFPAAIVNVSSISAETASPSRGEYCISKAGISMATRLWAVRLAEFNIPVYEVRPGIIETDMTAGVKERYDRLIAEGLLPQPRWGTPEDVGSAVALLLRGELPYSTGQVLHVDGGFRISRL
jgi:NAD(P)-dependent dehydrogenase (short-subunit alcohol dehydrogenase family)